MATETEAERVSCEVPIGWQRAGDGGKEHGVSDSKVSPNGEMGAPFRPSLAHFGAQNFVFGKRERVPFLLI